jgi:hypothetical protein
VRVMEVAKKYTGSKEAERMGGLSRERGLGSGSLVVEVMLEFERRRTPSWWFLGPTLHAFGVAGTTIAGRWRWTSFGVGAPQ